MSRLRSCCLASTLKNECFSQGLGDDSESTHVCVSPGKNAFRMSFVPVFESPCKRLVPYWVCQASLAAKLRHSRLTDGSCILGGQDLCLSSLGSRVWGDCRVTALAFFTRGLSAERLYPHPAQCPCTVIQKCQVYSRGWNLNGPDWQLSPAGLSEWRRGGE